MNHYSLLRNLDLSHSIVQRNTTHAVLLLVVTLSSLSLGAQPYRVNIPGTAFSAKWQGAQGTIEDAGTSRKFRGNSRTVLILQGAIQMHPSSSADHKMQRLVIHFRTSSSSPTLESVELRSGTHTEFHIETHLAGDFTREVGKPGTAANAWVWRSPIPVSTQSIIRLEIQFPGGFEGPGTPENFILTAVEVDYPLKSLPLSTGINATGSLNQLNKSVENKPAETRQPVTNQDKDDYAIIGEAMAQADSMVAAFRNLEQPGRRHQSGFDMGIGITLTDKSWGPGKEWFLNSLSVDQQMPFKKAAAFCLGRNNNSELAAKGMEIAASDPEVAAARALRNSGLFWLGFDIATGIFGDPALGALGNTSTGPGAERIRSTASEGERILLSTHEVETGFNASMAFHLARKYK